MKISIEHHDITQELCQSCAACCRITLSIPQTDSRYRKFLRQVGMNVQPAVVDGKADCCDDIHDITIDMGMCQHLEMDASNKYHCKLYGSEHFPELCKDFTCVSWAKARNAYNDGNALLVKAQTALNNQKIEESRLRFLRSK